jgi:FkbM family methyltransferase
MQLNTNLFLNRLQNVHPVCVALGERTEILVTPFIDYGKSANNGAYSLDELARAKLALDEGVDVFRPVYDPTTRMEVRVVPLDSLQLDLSRLALIKIDVEGFESKVLMGGKRTISEGGFPPILYEKWDSDWYQDRANETDQILNEMGYTISNLWGEVWLAQHPLWPIKLKILNTGANDDEGRPVLDLSLTVRDPNSPKLRRGIFGGADRQQEVKT